MQSALNKTREEEVFSVLLAYIHYRAMDMFSMDPPRDNISGTEENQIRIN
jgi:hypothetical protein